MQTELGKGKSSTKAQTALDELHYLTTFNQNVSFTVGKPLQHLSDFTFIQMANLTLVRGDSYLEHLKAGVKSDTFSALRNCPLNTHALFPDAVIRKAEDEIQQFETLKRTNQSGPGRGGFTGNHKKQNRFQPYSTNWKQGQETAQTGGSTEKDMPAWKSFGGRGRSRGRGRGGQPTAPALLRIKGSINDNYCLQNPVLVARAVKNVTNVEGQNFSVSVRQPVLCPVVSPVPFVLSVRGQSQKKDGSPSSKVKQEINFVKDVFSVDHCVFAPIVPNAHNVVNAQLIGGRLQKFGRSGPSWVQIRE